MTAIERYTDGAGSALVGVAPVAPEFAHLFADPVALFAGRVALGAQFLAKFPGALPGLFPRVESSFPGL